MTTDNKSPCPHCYDTGCVCGGIGLSCHGCCSCRAGKRARARRKIAVQQAVQLVRAIQRRRGEPQKP